jgi:threonyl-tRNA synthetase
VSADADKQSFLVVGAEEQKTRTVNIRNRDDPATQKHGALIPLQDALQKLIQLRDERRLKNEIAL